MFNIRPCDYNIFLLLWQEDDLKKYRASSNPLSPKAQKKHRVCDAFSVAETERFSQLRCSLAVPNSCYALGSQSLTAALKTHRFITHWVRSEFSLPPVPVAELKSLPRKQKTRKMRVFCFGGDREIFTTTLLSCGAQNLQTLA